MARVRIAEFGIIQKALAGAYVTFYETDTNGESTGDLATLYEASTGDDTIENPQTLDDDGKLAMDCYVESTIMAVITNITVATSRSIGKIRQSPLQYALPISSAAYLSSILTAEAVIAVLTLGWEGAWAVGHGTYYLGNITGNGGSSYICKLQHASGAASEPGVGAQWTTYWDLFASEGAAGAGTGDMLAANNLSDLVSAVVARTNLGLVIGTHVQAYDAELAALAALTSAANKMIRFTGSGTADLIDFKDEDTMVSNSDSAVPSQQSVKAYVDSFAASGLVLVGSVVASGASQVDFIHGTNGVVFDGTYKKYLLVGDDIVPGTDAVPIRFRTTADGVTFNSGASDYRWMAVHQGGAGTVNGVYDEADTMIDLCGGGTAIGNDVNEGAAFAMWLTNPAGTSFLKGIQWDMVWSRNDALINQARGAGQRRATAAITGFRLYMSSGTISGTFKLYGLKA